MQNDKTTPFMINVAQEVLSDLQLRLKNTRWSYQIEGTRWDAGTDLNYLKQLVAYWLDPYNWRERETALVANVPLCVGASHAKVTCPKRKIL
jgi:hypothetical protein